jgi:branched-chain amino acid aminotransferase
MEESTVKAWLNGEFIDWDQANISLLSHSFGRGSGIFEVTDIVPAEDGPAYFGLPQHIDRLFNTAEFSYMELPRDRDALIQVHIETARHNQVQEGAAKFFAYYPMIEFSVLPTNPQVDLALFCVDYQLFGVKQEELSAPVSAGISSFRKINPEAVPVHAKVAGNYVNAFLAKKEVTLKGYGDVLMLDAMGFVAEGATSNVFLVKDGRVLTPGLRSALPGITRAAVMEALSDLGIPIQEADLKPQDFFNADEAFYSGSIVKIQPISSVEGRELKAPCPGPVTAAIADKFKAILSGKDKLSSKWLTPIR